MKKQMFVSKLLLLTFALALGVIDTKAQSTQYVRFGVRTLFPNIAGGHGEFVLPVGKRNLSIAGDFSRIPLGEILTNTLDLEGEVDASYSYMSIGANFYPRSDERARGFYFGLSYAKIAASSSYDDGTDAAKAKISVNTANFRLGTNAGKGVFMFGFEIGAGLPFGNIKGDYISVEDGQYSRESYNEPAPLGVLPILNLTLGLAF